MVYVVKIAIVVDTQCINAGTSVTDYNYSRIIGSLRVALDLDSWQVWKLYHRKRTGQHSTTCKLLVACCKLCTLYNIIVQGYLYPQDYVSQENAWSSTIGTHLRRQHTLVRYSLDTYGRYSTLSPNFKSQKGSITAMNVCMIISYRIAGNTGEN